MEKYHMVDGKFVSVHFPSIVELMEHKLDEGNPNKSEFKQYMTGGHVSGRHGDEWLGPTCSSHDDVVRGALLGDNRLYTNFLLKKIDQLRQATGRLNKDYKQAIKTAKRKPMFGAYGDEIDIHKVYQGRLDSAWRRTKRIETHKETKLVTLFVQIAGTARYSAVDSLWRAAVAVLLMEDLLNAGKSVKIVVGGTSTDVTTQGHTMTVSITVKEYNEKLSLEKLAAMSHLGFYRTFGFASKACQPYELTYGLGSSIDMPPSRMPIQFREDIHKGHSKFIVLNRCLNSTEAVRSINSALEQMKEFSDEPK